MLTRDGTSSYYINNQPVRRRDVQDMFLGTGLGSARLRDHRPGHDLPHHRGRPEELRLFLEEAAGVSKYKERRRETENRLADTRENLTRVEDILRELDSQIGQLEQQAEVATRYRTLQTAHDEQQQLLWLSRATRGARGSASRQRATSTTRTTALEVACRRAAPRRARARRRATRPTTRASDALHAAQGALLQATLEVAGSRARSAMSSRAATGSPGADRDAEGDA